MKTKILWIARYAPYDKVRHAGGQNANYYLKRTVNENDFEVKLISLCEDEEYNDVKNDYNKYKIEHYLFCAERDNNSIKNKIINYEERFSPFNRYANFCDLYTARSIVQCCKELRKEGYNPDCVILQWTQVILLSKQIKKIFPSSKIISIEEDVAYLGRERKYNYMRSGIKKLAFYYKYKRLERLEIKALRISSSVFATNDKDQKLLKRKGIESLRLVSYFTNYSNVERKYDSQKDIIFFGAMNRDENYLSAIWFIDNVMPLLDEDYRFIVVGNKPDTALVNRKSNRIIITGFVESVDPYFANSLCFVAPLQLGAGIKLKVLEAMSSGIPIIANDIGIEGIPAQEGISYIHCTEPSEFAKEIIWLYNHRNKEVPIFEKNGRELVKTHFNYISSYGSFLKAITT